MHCNLRSETQSLDPGLWLSESSRLQGCEGLHVVICGDIHLCFSHQNVLQEQLHSYQMPLWLCDTDLNGTTFSAGAIFADLTFAAETNVFWMNSALRSISHHVTILAFGHIPFVLRDSFGWCALLRTSMIKYQETIDLYNDCNVHSTENTLLSTHSALRQLHYCVKQLLSTPVRSTLRWPTAKFHTPRRSLGVDVGGVSSFTNDAEIRKHKEISTVIDTSILLYLPIQIHYSSTMFYDSGDMMPGYLFVCVCVSCHVVFLTGLGVT